MESNSLVLGHPHHGLTLSLLPDGRLSAKLVAEDGFRAEAAVFAYQPDLDRLSEFFDELAKDWAGWTGKKEWMNDDGRLILAAETDPTGHVSLHVRMGDDALGLQRGSSLDAMPDLRVATDTIHLVAGELEVIAAAVKRFVRSARHL